MIQSDKSLKVIMAFIAFHRNFNKREKIHKKRNTIDFDLKLLNSMKVTLAFAI